VTSSPSDAEAHPLRGYADDVARAVGGEASIDGDTVKVRVPADAWVSAHETARDELGLVFFSFLSAIDWANDPAAGESLSDEVEERYELITTVADLAEGRRVTFSVDLPKDDPSIPTLTGVYAGADWHERETAEMFAIDFIGHPGLDVLYLPEDFSGHPLQKSYPLLSREVKPWPGSVDVEPMPEAEKSAEKSAESAEAR